jgi:anti-anti-sigma factor
MTRFPQLRAVRHAVSTRRIRASDTTIVRSHSQPSDLLGVRPDSDGGRLRAWLERPTSRTVIVHVAGEVDDATAPELAELLGPRLASTLDSVVIDLSRVSFLGLTGVGLVEQARHRADVVGITLSLVTGPRCVDRALRAAELANQRADVASDHMSARRSTMFV